MGIFPFSLYPFLPLPFPSSHFYFLIPFLPHSFPFPFPISLLPAFRKRAGRKRKSEK